MENFQMNELIAVIAAVTALLAVLLGPLVSMWTTNTHTRIALRSNNRQVWINTLRESISDFSSTARVVSLSKEFADKYSRAEKLFFLEEKMKLLVNPKEADHQKLILILENTRKAAMQIFAAGTDDTKKDAAQKELKTSLNGLTEISQIILKSEWERVKKAE
jgi:hypothetical protein